MTSSPPIRPKAPTAHIVVTCANRKRQPIPAGLRIQSIPRRGGVERRFDAWIERLATSDVPALPAGQLYGGEHWQIARTLEQRAAHGGHAVRVWVCSAGYGLVPMTAPLRPYAATFAFGQADSVAATTPAVRGWWDHHTAWVGPGTGHTPRSLAALATHAPRAALLLVLSGPYLRACGHDVAAAADQLRHPDQLSVISTGSTVPSDLREFVLPADGRLQGVLGGSMQALNVRIAAHLLETHQAPLQRPALADTVTALGHGRQRPAPLQRTPLSDDQVRTFITTHWTERATHTRLLRQLRDSGLACEQQRFARLFADTVRSL
jgi:hypothetical protein